MEKLIVSMMRFSTAMTLFGMEQVQSAMNTMGGGEDLSTSLDRFRRALDSFTDAMIGELDHTKRETLESVTNVSEDAIHRTMEGVNLSMMDPREVIRTSADLMKKTSDSLADFMAGSEKGEDSSKSGEPKRAAEALSGQGGKSGKKKAN